MLSLWSPFLHVRWSTVLMAALILVAVAWWSRRPGLAALTVLAWASLYELIWQVADLWNGDPSQTVRNLVWMTAAIGVAPVFARYLGVRLWTPAYLVSAAGFVAWFVQGFHWNAYGQGAPLLVWPEVWNVVTKDALGVAYLVGALRAAPGGARPPAASPRPAGAIR